MYTPSQFAKKVGVSVKTIQKWDRIGVLPAKRTITNRRYYTDEDLAAALRLPRLHKDPFDRILLAQAISEGITLLTTDAQVARYGGPVRKV